VEERIEVAQQLRVLTNGDHGKGVVSGEPVEPIFTKEKCGSTMFNSGKL